jgi:hypothetical protein
MKFKMPRGVWWGSYFFTFYVVLIVFLPAVLPANFDTTIISAPFLFISIGFWIDAFTNRKKPKN